MQPRFVFCFLTDGRGFNSPDNPEEAFKSYNILSETAESEKGMMVFFL